MRAWRQSAGLTIQKYSSHIDLRWRGVTILARSAHIEMFVVWRAISDAVITVPVLGV